MGWDSGICNLYKGPLPCPCYLNQFHVIRTTTPYYSMLMSMDLLSGATMDGCVDEDRTRWRMGKGCES